MQEQLASAPQVSGFGATEACGFLTLGITDEPLDARVNTTGLPLEGMELRVVDVETERDAAPGQLGEIRYRGYARFDGYYKDPERTAEVIDADGWFHSGDMGTLDEAGRLTYVTRLKDMLKVGGENVAAAEIEGFLLTHPAVLMAQVVSAPDARYVEVPAAFVIPKPGATVTEAELIDHCLGRIATFKVPRYVRFVTEYPMSGTKVKKVELRAAIAAELAAAGITEAPKLSTPRG
jgi:fatty-acyl-CoA synthase